MFVNLAESILGSGVTFEDSSGKIAALKASFMRQPAGPPQEMAKGCGLAIEILESERKKGGIINTAAVIQQMNLQLERLFQNPTLRFVAQGFLAALLFCRDGVKEGFSSLMSCLEQALLCVEEAMRHLHQFTKAQQAVQQPM